MATRKEIIDRSSVLLSVVGVGETLSPEDFEIIANTYDSWHELKSQRNKIYWPDNDCVPLEAENLVIAIVSGVVIKQGNDFGLDDNEISKILGSAEDANRELRKLMKNIPTGQRVKACYF